MCHRCFFFQIDEKVSYFMVIQVSVSTNMPYWSSFIGLVYKCDVEGPDILSTQGNCSSQRMVEPKNRSLVI